MRFAFSPKKGQAAYTTPSTPTTAQTYAATGSSPHWDAGRAGEQMGSGSAYGKGLSEAQKLYAIKSLTGKDFDAFSGPKGYGSKLGQSTQEKFSGLFDTDAGGNRFLKEDAGGLRKKAVNKSNADLAEEYRKQMLDKAYDQALGDLYSDRDLSDEELTNANLEKTLTGHHGKEAKWVERTNKLTGEKGFAPVKTKDAKYGSNFLSSSWTKEKDDWIEGLGAAGALVATILTGNPLIGAGIYGYAKSESNKAGERIQEKKAGGQARAAAGAGALNPQRLRQLRDVARSRAAGAGTFNYTEQVES